MKRRSRQRSPSRRYIALPLNVSGSEVDEALDIIERAMAAVA